MWRTLLSSFPPHYPPFLFLINVGEPASHFPDARTHAPAMATGLTGAAVEQAGHSVRLQHAQPQKFDIRAAIHLALEELEPVDMTLGLAVAPWQPEGRPYSR